MSALLTPPAAPATPPALMTAEEFFDKYEDGGYELVDGILVEMPMPGGIHGQVCINAGFELKLYLRNNPIGTVFGNDTFVRLRRNPDTMRGPDVCFVSYDALPAADVPAGPLTVIPELVFEVRSPSDSWPEMERKAADYLRAGVTAAVIVDPRTASATVFRTGGQDTFAAADTLTVPDILPGFAVVVGTLFA